MGSAMAIMMAKVPQDVPVEKAMNEERMNTTAGNRAGDSHPSVIPATYSPVPRLLHTWLMEKASIIPNEDQGEEKRQKETSSLI